MNILVINGDCVQVNSSANLCHLAYIRGLVDAGHRVALLSADGRDYRLDPAMTIPDEVEQHTVYGVSLYEKLSMKKRAQEKTIPAEPTETADEDRRPGIRTRLARSAKSAALSLYGVHGIYMKFVHKAKRFRSDKEFDCVISLSTPVTSHLLTHELLRTGHIRARRWIQLWEDPWYSDAYGFNGKKEIFEEEKRLLSSAERVCYVSPITLENQRRLFPEAADKMYWQPLPSYYDASGESSPADPTVFGYFGGYSLPSRDLRPFYKAAMECGITVNICGESNLGLRSTDSIRIRPRLSLSELKPIEDSTGVLVFLCNRAGGQIPGKIYQYSATNKTILFILDGTEKEKEALRAFFAPYNRYIFCENTAEDIAKAILKIRKGELDGVRNKALTDFSPEKIVQRVLEEGMR